MLKAIHADISTLEIDAIVNAANESLLGGGGVDGAIHRAAGPNLLKSCRALGGCPTGEARVTPGFDLSSKHVIHTVGPVYHDGQHGEPALLANCYRNSLKLARDNSIRTIAFPGISTGVYGYPKEEAATIAVAVCREVESDFDEIVFCCFSESDKKVYSNLLVQTRR